MRKLPPFLCILLCVFDLVLPSTGSIAASFDCASRYRQHNCIFRSPAQNPWCTALFSFFPRNSLISVRNRRDSTALAFVSAFVSRGFGNYAYNLARHSSLVFCGTSPQADQASGARHSKEHWRLPVISRLGKQTGVRSRLQLLPHGFPPVRSECQDMGRQFRHATTHRGILPSRFPTLLPPDKRQPAVELRMGLSSLFPSQFFGANSQEKQNGKSEKEDELDRQIPPNLRHLINSGAVPGSASPQMSEALKKTTAFIGRLNTMQDHLAGQEIAGEAGGLAEPSPQIPTDLQAILLGSPQPPPAAPPSMCTYIADGDHATPSGKGNDSGDGAMREDVSKQEGENLRNDLEPTAEQLAEGDAALIRVVYKGTGQPLRVELNDECMGLEREQLERVSISFDRKVVPLPKQPPGSMRFF